MSKANVVLRDISPVMQKIQGFPFGGKHTNALRFEPLIADRTQPPPQIPDGVSHKHAQNYYFTRDARREVAPPVDLSKKLLEASSDKEGAKQAANVRPTPGPVYQWDKHY